MDISHPQMYITFDVGTLKPGASTVLSYYTALDAGAIGDILAGLQCKGDAPPPSLSGDGLV